MELEDGTLSRKISMSVAQRVKKYREQRKNDAMYKKGQGKRMENSKNFKVCMPETEISSYKAAAKERKRRNRALRRARAIKRDSSGKKGSYRTHYVKKTVKNTYKTLPRAPDEQAEVLAKLAEQALSKLQSLGPSPKRNLLRAKVKTE